MYEVITILDRKDSETIVMYICLKRARDSCYSVHSAEFFNRSESKIDTARPIRNTFELMFEESPDSRCRWYDTIEEAVRCHISAFSEI